MTTTDQEVSSPQQALGPWMTVPEAADHSRRALDTVRKACREFEKTSGKSGLKSLQPSPFANRRIHVDDLTRWMASKTRANDKRRSRAA